MPESRALFAPGKCWVTLPALHLVTPAASEEARRFILPSWGCQVHGCLRFLSCVFASRSLCLWVLDVLICPFISILCVRVFAYLYVCTTCVQCPWTPEERTGVTESREPPCGCWELNRGPLQEQPWLLTGFSTTDS